MNDGMTELVLFGLVMLGLLLFGISASALFIRQWRREQRDKQAQRNDIPPKGRGPQ